MTLGPSNKFYFSPNSWQVCNDPLGDVCIAARLPSFGSLLMCVSLSFFLFQDMEMDKYALSE
jgi:hypothetical protein